MKEARASPHPFQPQTQSSFQTVFSPTAPDQKTHSKVHLPNLLPCLISPPDGGPHPQPDRWIQTESCKGHCQSPAHRHMLGTCSNGWVGFRDTQISMLLGITQKRNVRSKVWWFTRSCNSHYVSHFAAFFIDARTKISVAKSCSFVKIKLTISC